MDDSRVIEIDDFISASTCEMIISMCESKDIPEDKMNLIEAATGTVLASDRVHAFLKRQFKQTRLKFRDTNIHSVIDSAITHHNTQEMTILLNDLFTYVRYDDGGSMPKHTDDYKDTDATHTIIVYLNDAYTGGEVYIKENDVETKIVPKIGKAIIFESNEIPNGCHVVNGTKKILIGTIAVINAVITSASAAY